MSLGENKTFELQKSFMQRRKEIENNLTTELFSMRVYNESYDFINFNPSAQFEKWAALEVVDFNIIPYEMEAYVLPAGL